MTAISTKQQVTTVVIELTPDEASKLYRDISDVLSEFGIHSANMRDKKPWSALYSVYDALYHVGAESTIVASDRKHIGG